MKVALIGDTSDHGGTIINSGGNDTVKVNGVEIAIDGALHSCPIEGHGITPITAITERTFIDGVLVITEGAVAGCGAVMQAPDRGVNIE